MKKKILKICLLIALICGIFFVGKTYGFGVPNLDPYQGSQRVYTGNAIPVSLKTDCIFKDPKALITGQVSINDKNDTTLGTQKFTVTAEQLETEKLLYSVPNDFNAGNYYLSLTLRDATTTYYQGYTQYFVVVERYFPGLAGFFYPLGILLSILGLGVAVYSILRRRKLLEEKPQQSHQPPETNPTFDQLVNKKQRKFVMR